MTDPVITHTLVAGFPTTICSGLNDGHQMTVPADCLVGSYEGGVARSITPTGLINLQVTETLHLTVAPTSLVGAYAAGDAQNISLAEPVELHVDNSLHVVAGATALLGAFAAGDAKNITPVAPLEILADLTLRLTYTPVQGPATSTATAVPRFTDTTGTLLEDSGVLVDASNNVTGVAALTATVINATDLIKLTAFTNASPLDGQLWYDGTHLFFRHGATTATLV